MATARSAKSPIPKAPAPKADAGPVLLLVATRKGAFLYRSDKGRRAWRVTGPLFFGHIVHHLVLDPRTGPKGRRTLLAATSTGHLGPTLMRSTDLGRTWQESTRPPAFPKAGKGEKGRAVDHTFWLTPGHASEPGVWYAGTSPQGLFRSEDDGLTWSGVAGFNDNPKYVDWTGGEKDGTPDGPKLHSINVDPRDAKRLYVAMSSGGVFESRDRGASWKPLNEGVLADFRPDKFPEYGQDAHCVRVHPLAPDVLWQQNHCGIFRSTDGARTWSACSKKGSVVHFGFAIAADERDPAQAWVVPAVADECRVAPGGKLVTAHTHDGGKSWKLAKRGLPQRDVYDVVYRHALDQRAGTLCFGSTTGNVYVSDDRGVSWTCVANHLPPVYSVRFA